MRIRVYLYLVCRCFMSGLIADDAQVLWTFINTICRHIVIFLSILVLPSFYSYNIKYLLYITCNRCVIFVTTYYDMDASKVCFSKQINNVYIGKHVIRKYDTICIIKQILIKHKIEPFWVSLEYSSSRLHIVVTHCLVY